MKVRIAGSIFVTALLLPFDGSQDRQNHILAFGATIEDYPNCHVDHPEEIGDGNCDGFPPWQHNTAECGWDGGDCVVDKFPECHVEYPDWIGDGTCDGGDFNSARCGWDGGDCLEFNALYPDCHVFFSDKIGNGLCEGGLQVFDPSHGDFSSGGFNTEECGWDGGDCLVEGYPDCHVNLPSLIGNGECNGEELNTAECGWDGGDCLNFNTNYPDCHVHSPEDIGDGRCVGYANTAECGWDGGDCDSENTKLWKTYPNCKSGVDPADMGDGECDAGSGRHNTEECGWDGGDCLIEEFPDCHVDWPSWIGDGWCQGDEYNTAKCGWEGGDCLVKGFPDCHVDNPRWIGDGTCDKNPWDLEYNTINCGWDGGDCIEANKLDPPPGWPGSGIVATPRGNNDPDGTASIVMAPPFFVAAAMAFILGAQI